MTRANAVSLRKNQNNWENQENQKKDTIACACCAETDCLQANTFVNKSTGCSLKTEEWMTTEEAAEFLRVPRASLLNLSSNGKVPFYKFQRRNRYLKSDLLKLLLSNRQGGFNGN